MSLLHSLMQQFPPDVQSDPEQDFGTFSTLDAVCAGHIRKALGRSRGKISGPGGTAELLGLHPNTLRQRMDKLEIAFRKKSKNYT